MQNRTVIQRSEKILTLLYIHPKLYVCISPPEKNGGDGVGGGRVTHVQIKLFLENSIVF